MPHLPSHLGPYEIVGLVGKGGMGEVYRARDSRLGRYVAIKVLPAEFNEDPTRKARFEHEARAASALNHPNIVSLYDIGRENGIPFIVSELIDGQPLRGLIQEGPVPPGKLVEIALQAAEGLRAAHMAGIVHRDLKPENLMLTRDGRVKILDFGLAKLALQRLGAAESTQTQLSTVPGVVMGTVGYMSPEQVRGKPADARSDIFSLGAVLYEMAVGKRAFPGGDTIEVLSAILREKPAKLPGSLPKALDRIIQRSLEKEPAGRFQDASELVSALKRIGAVSNPRYGSWRRWLWAPAAIVVAGSAWLAPHWLNSKRLETAPPMHSSIGPSRDIPQPAQPPLEQHSSQADVNEGPSSRKPAAAPPVPQPRITQPPAVSAAPIIETIAGREWKFTGDGMPALEVTLGPSRGLACDIAGNVYASDFDDGALVKIDTRGILHVLAGPGSPLENRPFRPMGIAVDSSGAIYFGEAGHLLRKLLPDGRVVTAAGGDKPGDSPDGAPALGSLIGGVQAVVIASDGTPIFSDSNNRVRRVDRDGRLETVAGNGQAAFAGDGGPPKQASLQSPRGLTLDASGNLYIADSGNHRVREVTHDGRIKTIAGGDATAPLRCPEGVVVNGKDELFITDPCKSQVFTLRRGQLSVAGGTGSSHNQPIGMGGSATEASFDERALALDPAGNLLVSSQNGQVYRIGEDGKVNIVAGTGRWRWAPDGTPAAQAVFQAPFRMAIDHAGDLFLTDFSRCRIYRIDQKRIATQIAGSDWVGYQGENTPARDYGLWGPLGLALRPDGGLIFSELVGNRVREITPDGKLRTLAGNGRSGFSGDGGRATESSLREPQGVCLDSAGNLYIADSGNQRVRKVTLDGRILTVAGNGTPGYSGDGAAAERASLKGPRGVAVGPDGNLYIAEALNRRIRRVAAGVIATIAGTGAEGSSGDGGPAVQATFVWPYDLAFGPDGRLYVLDTIASRIRRIDLASGIITTFAGNGERIASGGGGPATNAGLGNPRGIAIDERGNVYVTDIDSATIRVIRAVPHSR